ncbi:MAG: heat-inducible transcriptional repressor HrcA [Halanaerobiales bacterium]
MVKEVDRRKKKILKAIIHEHILSAEPIGSRTLAKSYKLGISSATIRNEMSDLEELGYIKQPYTSAGRVPSDKGYRYYVDTLMKEETDRTIVNIKKLLKDIKYEQQDIQNIMSHMVKMLSQVTHYTSIISGPQLEKSKIRKLQLLPVDNSILIVLITDTGIVHNKVVKINKRLKPHHFNYLNQFFGDRLENKEINKITSDYLKELEHKVLNRLEISRDILEMIYKGLNKIYRPDDFKLYLGGTSYILDQPEFKDTENLKKVLKILDHEEVLKQIFSSMSNKELEVLIGHENELEDMHKCSLVFATYSAGDKASGKIGVIGPTRMEYSRVINSVNSVAKLMGKIISELSG